MKPKAFAHFDWAPLCRGALILTVMLVLTTALHASEVRIQGGLVVCVGADALESVSDDWKKQGCLFHCLETSDAEVARLRILVQDAGCYGKVSVARFDGGRLPYINNLVNTVVIRDARFDISAGEVERVLAPYGTAVAPADSSYLPKPTSPGEYGFVTFTKPFPSDLPMEAIIGTSQSPWRKATVRQATF